MKCFKCNGDLIYLGANYHPNMIAMQLASLYIYCCSMCGQLEWSLTKEKCKFKWYKCDKDKLKELVGGKLC